MEVKRIKSGPFNFILYDDGEIAASSNGYFINLKERPEVLAEAKSLLQKGYKGGEKK